MNFRRRKKIIPGEKQKMIRKKSIKNKNLTKRLINCKVKRFPKRIVVALITNKRK